MDGQTMANSIVPLLHFVRQGTKMSLDAESPHQCKKFWECSKPSLIDSYKLQEGGRDRKIFVAFLTLSYVIRLPYWCTYYATCSTSWELAPLGMGTVVVDAKEITTFWQVPFVCLSVNHFLHKKFKNYLVFSAGFLIPHELHSACIWLYTKYCICHRESFRNDIKSYGKFAIFSKLKIEGG